MDEWTDGERIYGGIEGLEERGEPEEVRQDLNIGRQYMECRAMADRFMGGPKNSNMDGWMDD